MIYEKLALIQQRLHAPKNLKNEYNGYSYRNAESILMNLKPLLHEYGVLLFFRDEPLVIDGWHYIKTTATLIDIDDDTRFETSSVARESVSQKGFSDMQISGSAITYVHRYCLCSLFCIDDSSLDVDSDKYQSRVRKAEESFSKTLQLVKSLCTKNNIDFYGWLARSGKQEDDLTEDDLYKMQKHLQSMVA